jgi:hypothetical protein
MAYRFEFDAANQILLIRFEGRLTNEVLGEFYQTARKYVSITDAKAGIVDLSSVSQFGVSDEFIHHLARQEPVMDEALPRFIVAPTPLGFGISRMFQLGGESTRRLLKVVHTMEEALEALDVQSPHFEPLERR